MKKTVNKKENNNLKVRRSTISRSKVLKDEYKKEEIKFLFLKMFADLTKRLNENNYQTSRIRIHLESLNYKSENTRFTVTLDKPTSSLTKLLKAVLPLYISKVNQDINITRIGISFEKISLVESKTSIFKQMIFYKNIFQN